jgi:hypothetical protein
VDSLYLYGRNKASFHALFLTGVDAALRALFKNNINGWNDMAQRKGPPPRG